MFQTMFLGSCNQELWRPVLLWLEVSWRLFEYCEAVWGGPAGLREHQLAACLSLYDLGCTIVDDTRLHGCMRCVRVHTEASGSVTKALGSACCCCCCTFAM